MELRSVLDALASGGVELAPEELLDALWLARRLPADHRAPLAGAVHPRSAGGAPAGPERDTPPGPAATGPVPPPDPVPTTPARPLYATDRAAARPAGAARLQAVRVPEFQGLPDQLPLGRALRPLKRHRPSLRHTEVDEAATVAATADGGVLEVVLRPARERWLRCDLVVDDGISMLIWQRTVTDLRLLLERSGAFRDVRVHGLRTRGPGGVRLVRSPYGSGTAGALDPATLADPTGETLFLVFSDGAGAAWRDGRMHTVLQRWAASGPTAVLHALPRRMWPGTGLAAGQAAVRTSYPGARNADWQTADEGGPGVPIPVLDLTPAALFDWSRFLAAPNGETQLPLWEPHPAPGALRRTAAAPPPDQAAAARLRLERFQRAASPAAHRLAAHLAARSPVTVPVMRLIQATLLGTADTVPLAEVVLGGLLRPTAPAAERPAAHRTFDFPAQVKDVLLDSVPTAELLDVSGRVGRLLDELVGRSADFPSWLDTGGSPGPHRTGSPFAWAGRTLLHRLGVGEPAARERAERESADRAAAERTAGLPSAAPTPAEPLTAELPPTAAALATTGRMVPRRPGDPRAAGPYRVLGRSATEEWAYVGADDGGAVVNLRILPDDHRQRIRLIRAEARNLRSVGARYAPKVVAEGTDDLAPWLATAVPLTPAGRPAPTLREFVDVCGPLLNSALLHHLALHLALALRRVLDNGIAPVQLDLDRIVVTGDAPVVTDWRGDPAVSRLLSDERSWDAVFRRPLRSSVGSLVHTLGEVLFYCATGREYDPAARDGDDYRIIWGDMVGKPTVQDRRWLTLVAHCLREEPNTRPGLDRLVAEFRGRLAAGAEDTRLTAWMPQRGRALLNGHQSAGPRPPAVLGGGATEAAQPASAGAAGSGVEPPPPPTRFHRIAVLAPVLGTGLATTAVMLGAALTRSGGRPVVALDSGRGAHALSALGHPTVSDGLWWLAEEEAAPGWAALREYLSPGPEGVHILGGGRRHEGLTGGQYRRVLSALRGYYDTTVTTCRAPTLDTHVRAVLDSADRLVLVDGPEHGLRDTAALLELLEWEGHRALARSSVVAVVHTEPGRGGPAGHRVPEVAELCGEVVTIPYDEGLQDTGFGGRLTPSRATRAAFGELAGLVDAD
ncbi:SAV_2336 N-terminal domain-related protein [Kitasatospora sp. NPDC056138]|uniref:SAV_2336 N-terminal domain-related protein n=1 Tax=Kitasatospora sp. NPDC056138 TaxID=3345724 RepID=UPI0035DDFE8B